MFKSFSASNFRYFFDSAEVVSTYSISNLLNNMVLPFYIKSVKIAVKKIVKIS